MNQRTELKRLLYQHVLSAFCDEIPSVVLKVNNLVMSERYGTKNFLFFIE